MLVVESAGRVRQCASDIARALEKDRRRDSTMSLAFTWLGIAPVARRSRHGGAECWMSAKRFRAGSAAGESYSPHRGQLGALPLDGQSGPVARHGGRSSYRATEADARAWERGAAPKGVSSGQPSQATMASRLPRNWRSIGRPRRSRGGSQRRVPCRRRLAGVPRNHLSQFVCPGPQGAQESSCLGIFGLRRSHALSERRHHAQPGYRDRSSDAISIRERPARHRATAPFLEARHRDTATCSAGVQRNQHMATLVEARILASRC